MARRPGPRVRQAPRLRIRDGSGTELDLSLQEAVELGMGQHRLGQIGVAEQIYKAVLELDPRQVDALHFSGVAAHQRGDSAAALRLIQRAIALAPGVPGMYNNLGNVLVEQGDAAGAAAAYRKALQIAPVQPNTFNNLGIALKAQGLFDEAHAAYARAVELDPEFADAYHNFGNLLAAQGRTPEAVDMYFKALTLAPERAISRQMLGQAYSRLGRLDRAREIYEKWLAEDPANPVANFLLAACTGENVPDRATDAYVEHCFDNFAESFDSKLEYLGYRAPELVASMLTTCAGAPAHNLRIADAGCGTGLCAPLLAPHAAKLYGVDLSAGMLERAAARGGYDELEKAELTAYLEARVGAFDVIVSADTLVYFGPLERVARAACLALDKAGWFIFSCERALPEESSDGYKINYQGRYAHAESYVRRVLQSAGFDSIEVQHEILRSEGGYPVHGLVVGAAKREPTTGLAQA
ncbi:MAG: tetratricopeptide repeat protein [Rhodocyclaceae bacterium]|nr:tetratricopeptide repeat protein [Rhodocyclaceae bacterium]MBX3668195.1 tetratricopeptide repeat protein [Rhodocyclaceae bacterium]